MPQREPLIESVFSKFLGHRARKLEADGLAEIIPTGSFMGIAPVHEDGSVDYDPRKPLALFAIKIVSETGRARWAADCREWDALRAEARAA
ncbi:hypothetical protein Q8W71_13890 [Methylobacterium sp. NEAU 140]|uniref:hypothetical protein n=1 Tax=Methylobacterium sp. NEAU 140 TaxID=3064945 RepID=UPI0027376624|nr:hypothetical protein [Methylobacterium sp. NEAU 140]MDP4023723.1 hypothetical protein [Methylobacterium sp. NEAU 140]